MPETEKLEVKAEESKVVEKPKVEKPSLASLTAKLDALVNVVGTLAQQQVAIQATSGSSLKQATGKKTGNQIDMATLSHMVPTQKRTGYNVFLKSQNFETSYRVWVKNTQAAKMRVGKQIAVYAYHKNGKENPATSYKITLAAGISKYGKLPSNEAKEPFKPVPVE